MGGKNEEMERVEVRKLVECGKKRDVGEEEDGWVEAKT